MGLYTWSDILWAAYFVWWIGRYTLEGILRKVYFGRYTLGVILRKVFFGRSVYFGRCYDFGRYTSGGIVRKVYFDGNLRMVYFGRCTSLVIFGWYTLGDILQ